MKDKSPQFPGSSKPDSVVRIGLSGIGWPVVSLDTSLVLLEANSKATEYFKDQLEDTDSGFLTFFDTDEDEPIEELCKFLVQEGQTRHLNLYYRLGHQWFEADLFTHSFGLTLLLKPKKQESQPETSIPPNSKSVIFENMQELYLLVDEEFRIIDTNPTFCKTAGYTRNEILGKNVREFDNLLSPEQFQSILSASKRGESLTLQSQMKTQSDKILDMEINIFPISISGKKYHAALGRDVSDCKKIQSDLRKSNDRLRLISNSIQDALWENNLETNEKWSSEVHRKLFGVEYERNSLSMEDWEARILFDPNKEISSGYLEAIEKKDKTWIAKYWFQSAYGKSFYVYDRAYFFYDADNQLTRIIGSMLDITELKNIQEQLTTQKTLGESIINALPDLFFLINKKNVFVRWNKNLEFVTGYTTDEIKKMAPVDFFEGAHPDLLLNKLKEVLQDGAAETEGFLITKTGKRISYLFNGQKTKVLGESMIIGTAKDISEIKRAEGSLKQMEKVILNQKIQDQKRGSRAIIATQERERQYIGRELHDNVNQLLAGTRLYLAMAGKKNSDIEEAIEYPLELLDKSIREIRTLTHRYIFPLKETDLHFQTKNLIQLLEAASINVNFDYGVKDLDVRESIRLNIYRILQEEVNNILKYAEAKNVNLSLQVKDCAIQLITTDDGKGFDTSGRWEGIGLSNITNRVDAYNGEIEIISSPGNGCTIKIQIPL